MNRLLFQRNVFSFEMVYLWEYQIFFEILHFLHSPVSLLKLIHACEIATRQYLREHTTHIFETP